MNLIKILHLEDADSDAGLILEELKKGNFPFEYQKVIDLSSFEKEFLDFAPSLIIFNYTALSNVPKKIESFLKNPRFFIPLILIADTYSKEIAAKMMRAGAADYFFKDRLERFPLAILNAFEKAKAEKEIRQQHVELIGNEKKIKTLIENISDAILLLDPKGIITYQSQTAERITGFSQQESTGRSIFEFTHPGDLETMTRYFKQVILQPGVSLQNSYRIRKNKGPFIWVEGTITSFMHDPNIKAIIINYRDITERKLAEDLLQQSEANLRTIFDNTDVSYVLSDQKFRILSFNSSAAYTYRKEFKVELKVGDNLLDYLPEDRKNQSRERFERVLRGEKVSYELSFAQPQAPASWYNVNMFGVRDERNTLLGLIISSEDINDRKRIELERNKMLSDILRHNKDLEQFAYIISHNLRSPVANILGLSALLEKSAEMDKEFFEKCMAGLALSVKKLDDVIIDLNYILQTRRETNEKKESVSFTELINDIKTSISGLIEKERIIINTNFTVNKFFTLKSYLHSIFFNLVYNSIKYRNPSISTLIEIQSKKVNNKLVLVFRDNGLGIDLNAHGSNIFGLYKKFHKHIEGKGMGLYMVKTQVEILGGKITVASEVDKGTTFTLEFEE